MSGAPAGGDLVSWFCTYTPLEILDAAGLVPARRFGDPASLESSDTLLHPAICPYVRACLAEEMAGGGPHHPAVFVNSCDGMRRLYDAWKDRFRDDLVYLVDLPRNTGAGAERLLSLEFCRLARALAGLTGTEVTAEGLQEAAHAREERRLAYLAAADGTSGETRLRLAMGFHAPAPDGMPAGLGGEDEGGGVPVVLTGNLLNPAGLVAGLDRAGARVAWIDLCNGDRAFATSTLPEGEDLDGLFASLARKYLERHPCARMADAGRRHDLLVEAVRETGARGVVYASLKFCDAYLYDFPAVQEKLGSEGIPVLRLESDYADGHAGQVLTRVEAFLEMLD
ncbi:MAG: 2-hydroxyacyl-CoA dehydratase family protein [Actinomycetota bacterium]|nr:2-hydroxyacyl-CoA dehydratase family protein [Actinomycetota bacterium]MDD5665682.1 2-hydroxyacyl-CoA dehydratase family protein [Actinomycetota bacterium]